MQVALMGINLSLTLLLWNLRNLIGRIPEACSLPASPASHILNLVPHVFSAWGHISQGITPPCL